MNGSDLLPIDDRIFLVQAIEFGLENGTFDDRKLGEIESELGEIAHKQIVMRSDDFTIYDIKKHTREAVGLIDLGLRYGSGKDLPKAARLLKKNRLIKFYQIGKTLKEIKSD